MNLSSGHGKPWTYKQVRPDGLIWEIIGVLGLVLALNARHFRHSGITSPAREIIDSSIMHQAGA